MKTFLAFILLAPGIVTAGESAPEVQRFRWMPKAWRAFDGARNVPVKVMGQKGDTPDNQVNIGLLSMKDMVLRGAGEVVGRSAQYVGPARVDSTWIQTVFSPSGQAVYSTGGVMKYVPDHLLAEVTAMDANGAFGLRKAQEQVSSMASASYIFPPRVEIGWERSRGFYPYWRVEYLDRFEQNIHFAKVDAKGRVTEQGLTGVNGADGRARVFPRGPKASDLSEQTLYGLVGDGSLSSAKLAITSGLNLNVWSRDLIFNFEPTQPQFEMVQVYYFMDNALRWMKNQLGVELNRPIQVKTHIGENGVSNNAFYHNAQIYLGTGDGQVYRDMLKDPSIVVHETIHAVIDVYAGLPSEGEGGSFNEGFADLFTAFILNNPYMGEVSYLKAPFRRTLKNELKAYQDFSKGVYKNGTIIGATFWDMREKIGAEKAHKIAFRTLVRLGSGARFDDFAPAVISAMSGICTAEEGLEVQRILAERGWRLVGGGI